MATGAVVLFAWTLPFAVYSKYERWEAGKQLKQQIIEAARCEAESLKVAVGDRQTYLAKCREINWLGAETQCEASSLKFGEHSPWTYYLKCPLLDRAKANSHCEATSQQIAADSQSTYYLSCPLL